MNDRTQGFSPEQAPQSSKRGAIWLPYATLLGGVAVTLLLWLLASHWEVRGLGADIRPDKVIKRLFALITESEFQQDYVSSLMRVLQATGAGMIAALVLGVCIGSWQTVDLLTRPLLYTVQSIPIVVLGLMFLLAMGPTHTASVAFVGVAIWLSTTPLIAAAVRNVEQNHLRVGRTVGMDYFALILNIVLPTIRPALLDGLRGALIVAWSFMAFAEVMGGDKGMGLRISELQRFDHTTDTFAYILAITGTVIASDLALRSLTLVLCPWRRETRT